MAEHGCCHLRNYMRMIEKVSCRFSHSKGFKCVKQQLNFHLNRISQGRKLQYSNLYVFQIISTFSKAENGPI